MNSEKITVKDFPENFGDDDVVLGDLTPKQYLALEAVVRLSPGYRFEVHRYSGGPSSKATHVLIFKEGKEWDGEVGLVGSDGAQYHDKNPETLAAVKRVGARVYRKSWSWQ